MYNLETNNLLDSINDILSIIGDYVEQDNIKNKETEKRKLFLKTLMTI